METHGKNWNIDEAKAAARVRTEAETRDIVAAFDSVPGGIFKSTPWPDCRILCANDGFFKIIGYSREELQKSKDDRMREVVFPPDLNNLLKAMSEQRGPKLRCEHRITCGDGSVKWISVDGEQFCDDTGALYIYGMIMDISKAKELEISLREKKALYDIAVEGSDLIIWSYDIAKDMLTHTQRSMELHHAPQMTRSHPLEYVTAAGCLRDDCRERARAVAAKMLSGAANATEDFWFRFEGDADWWCERVAFTTICDDAGAPVIVIGVGRNVTEEIRVKTEKQKMETAMHSAAIFIWEYDLTTGLCFYRPRNDGGSPVPDGEIIDTPYAMVERGRIHRDSIKDYIGLHKKIEAGAASASADVRMYDDRGREVWMRLSYRAVYDESRAVRAVGHAKDITGEIHAKAAKRQMEMALSASSLSLWSYDIRNKIFNDTNKGSERLGLVAPITGGCEAIIASGLVMPESREDYRELHRRIDSGQKSAEAVIHFDKSRSKIEWQRITYSTIFDGDEPVMAVGIGEDVSELMNAQHRYNEELSFQMFGESGNLLVKIRANATENKIESYIAQDNVSTNIEGLSYEEGMKIMAATAILPERREELLRILDRARVIKDFTGAEQVQNVEFQRMTNDGGAIWLNLVVKTFRNPETDDILCFIYAYDIDADKTRKIIIDRIAESEYQMVALIDVKSGLLKIHSENDREIKHGVSETSYSGAFVGTILPLIAADRKNEATGAFALEHVLKQVNAKGYYECSFPIISNGAVRHKKWRFCWLDEAHTALLLCRSDVTEFLARRTRQEELMRSALAQARAASVAKSDFLSSMSHEIRTPMNAIIGMTALAKEAAGASEEVQDCLSKVELSAQFLLALINDILDMSKIESGKAEVESHPLSWHLFLENICVICRGLAEKKSVRYICDIEEGGCDRLMGDATKLQQILINIISNAVKFTPECGSVTFAAKQHEPENGRVPVTFVVRDTGIGITESFLPHLFDPFAQGHSGNTSSYGGTGLGLAICKNLVSLMGGEISVKSREGQGAEFTVSLSLALCDEQAEKCASAAYAECPDGYDFKGRRLLLAEDHPLNVEVAKKMLAHRGFEVEVAANGEEALSAFTSHPEGWYDAVLMDIRMPRMDGLTATKLIRTAERGRAVSVPIIAMSANAFVEDMEKSRASGMDAHIAKPIDARRLYGTLYSLIEVAKQSKKHYA
ncbi:MAG: ATP-binding protein [Cloacibacillus sp.]